MMRDIGITAAANGWIVRVGCQTLVYESAKDLVADLQAYLANPDKTESRLLETKCFNAKHTMGPREMPCDTQCEATSPAWTGNQGQVQARRR